MFLSSLILPLRSTISIAILCLHFISLPLILTEATYFLRILVFLVFKGYHGIIRSEIHLEIEDYYSFSYLSMLGLLEQ